MRTRLSNKKEKYWLNRSGTMLHEMKPKRKKESKMKKTITLLSEEFENEQTGEKVEGITIVLDGMLKEFVTIIKDKNSAYPTNLSVIQAALMRGLEEIKEEISQS